MPSADTAPPASADADKLPRTSPRTLAILILVLIGLIAANIRAYFYPSEPGAWARIHDPSTLSVAEANRILSESGAFIDSIKTTDNITTETWAYKNRSGTWTIIVRFAKKPTGDTITSVQIRSDINHFPSFTRTWDYPPLSVQQPAPTNPAAPQSPPPSQQPASPTPPPPPAASAGTPGK